MKILLENIKGNYYYPIYKGAFNYDEKIHPLHYIEKAMANLCVERRSYQKDLELLKIEWDSVDSITSIEMQRNYHSNRVATIINDEIWKDPIIVYRDQKSILDGMHRYWAIY